MTAEVLEVHFDINNFILPITTKKQKKYALIRQPNTLLLMTATNFFFHITRTFLLFELCSAVFRKHTNFHLRANNKAQFFYFNSFSGTFLQNRNQLLSFIV